MHLARGSGVTTVSSQEVSNEVLSQCDENKPRCKKCDAYGISCDYVLPPSQASQPSLLTPVNRCASNPGSIDASVFTMSLADVGNMVLQVLRSATAFGTENERLSSFAMAGAPSAFHHFMQTAGTVGSMSKASKKVATGDMIRLAFQVRETRPFLPSWALY